jgi:drug/metabolite transporter (DMT)-like permease
VADLMYLMVSILAFGAMLVNARYVYRHRLHERGRIRLIQTFACGFVGLVMVLDAGHIIDMSDISGWLFLLGVVMVLSASLAEGIVDL